MNETVIRISEDGKITVEKNENGVMSHKAISPDSLLDCIKTSIQRSGISSGLLPKDCLSYTEYDSGDKDICILFPRDKADITFLNTEYKDFPLPRLVFGFNINKGGRIGTCRMGIIGMDELIKPETRMYKYPFSNVSSNGVICIGNNPLPKCTSLHTLASLPYLILAIPNNLHNFQTSDNKLNLEMRALLELLINKSPAFYYSDVLIPTKKTLGDFINCERS
jgi:hypothetical protein